MADARPVCYCGHPAALKKVTDTSKSSYGRWFWGCKMFNVGGGSTACGFFDWHGDAFGPQLGKVAPDLQKDVDGTYRCHLCGLNVTIAGEHKCRTFGTYACGMCGHCWTSGYSWSGEQQCCRSCGTYQEPAACQQLQHSGRRGTGRPHDQSNCSMCQQLGYACGAAARSGVPLFAQVGIDQAMASYFRGARYRPY